jgi:hypothetical protein
VKRSDSVTSRLSGKSDKSNSSKSGKKTHRHVDIVNMSAIRCMFEFETDETENGPREAIWIQCEDFTSDGRSLKQYPFIITKERQKFMTEFRNNYYQHRADGQIFVSSIIDFISLLTHA